MQTQTSIGPLLRHWRQRRRMSQQALSADAEVSPRHLSCVETGKARPSREMVLVLCSALEVPLRERNVLLGAAGFAPAYRETALADPELASIRELLTQMLQRHNPYPAVVIDGQWNQLMANEASDRLNQVLFPVPPPDNNILASLFDPSGLRPRVRNFESVARMLLARVNRDATLDDRSRALLERLRAFPDLPEDFAKPILDIPELVVPIELEVPGAVLRLLSTITTLGTAMDITLQELRIESYYPADRETRAWFAARVADGVLPGTA
ncbi:MAG: helix-turn-helix transcriptional regulator [Proteobacteria bacterium]|nr:helix-turn-helix transcriptional regulator [Pseudomonadota bacterium]